MATSEEVEVVPPMRRELWRPSRCCTIARPCSGDCVAMATSNLSSCVEDCGLQEKHKKFNITVITRYH